ncbi:MAG: NAD-binding protein, partial [Aestuariivirgaceae bacterium]
LLVGAEPADLADARPFLTPLSAQIVHFGPVGTGTAYKLMINLMGAVQIAAAAEGMALAEKAGLDLAQVARTLAAGQAASPQVVRNADRMAADHHDTDIAFTPPLRLKDAAYGVQLAHKLGLSVPFGDVACGAFKALCDIGFADLSESKVIEVARRNPL